VTSTRLIVGLVGLGVILPILFFGGPAGTTLVVAIALTIALDEYARMAFPDGPRVALAALVVGMAGILLPAAAFADAGPTLAGIGLMVVGT